jgi:hypothetical protein
MNIYIKKKRRTDEAVVGGRDRDRLKHCGRGTHDSMQRSPATENEERGEKKGKKKMSGRKKKKKPKKKKPIRTSARGS